MEPLKLVAREPDVLAVDAVLQVADAVQALARRVQEEYGVEVAQVLLVFAPAVALCAADRGGYFAGAEIYFPHRTSPTAAALEGAATGLAASERLCEQVQGTGKDCIRSPW